MKTIGIIGEGMLELSRSDDLGQYRIGHGGDAINTAVYAARLGADVRLFSALGDGMLSNRLLDAWRSETIDIANVRTIPGTEPALYLIENDEKGERNFHYWRDASPFRQLLDPGSYLDALPARLADCPMIFLTGISLAMLPEQGKERLLEMLAGYRKGGGQVAFDPNYRARLWGSKAEATDYVDRAYAVADLVLPSLDDEFALRGFEDAESLASHIAALGATEVVIKTGATGCRVTIQNQQTAYPAELIKQVVDSTAAGDSFNAGYLVTRMSGQSVETAVTAGQKLAAQVIQQRGAIVDLADP